MFQKLRRIKYLLRERIKTYLYKEVLVCFLRWCESKHGLYLGSPNVHNTLDPTNKTDERLINEYLYDMS